MTSIMDKCPVLSCMAAKCEGAPRWAALARSLPSRRGCWATASGCTVCIRSCPRSSSSCRTTPSCTCQAMAGSPGGRKVAQASKQRFAYPKDYGRAVCEAWKREQQHIPTVHVAMRQTAAIQTHPSLTLITRRSTMGWLRSMQCASTSPWRRRNGRSIECIHDDEAR